MSYDKAAYNILTETKKAFERAPENIYTGEFKDEVNGVIQILTNTYLSWFKRWKEYTDKHIAQEVFNIAIEQRNAKIWLRVNLYAAIKTLERLVGGPLTARQNNTDQYHPGFNYSFLTSLIFDCIILLKEGARIIEDPSLDFPVTKNILTPSFFAYYLAEQSVYSQNIKRGTFAELHITYNSVFSIRQFLELRLKNSLGILSCYSLLDNKLVFLTLNDYVRLIKAGEDYMVFPVDNKILIKIFRWANWFVHVGVKPFLWQVYWALAIIRPLTRGRSEAGKWSRYGDIRIQSSFFTSLEIYLSVIKQFPVRIVRLPSPEAVIE